MKGSKVVVAALLLGCTWIGASSTSQAGGFCRPEAPDPFCGGERRGAAGELSCTPFEYKPWTWQNRAKQAAGGQDPSWCNSPILKTLAGAAFQTKRAWMYFKDGKGSRDTNYWVFHGCDGAGIMPDCAGDIKYVERFYQPAADQSKVWCEGGITLQQVPKHGNDPDHARRQCMFKHPGTGRIYSNYQAGEWSWNETVVPSWMVASKASGAWGYGVGAMVQHIRNPFPKPAIVMVTYPWVCTPVGSNDDQSGLFTNPKTPGAKCYFDNEPLSDGQGQPGYPPQLQVYWMQLDRDGEKDRLTVYGYFLDTKGGPSIKAMNHGQSWTLYLCSQGECPW